MNDLLKKYPIACILGIITIVELIATQDMGGSILLWLGYGLYKAFAVV